ncbi:hypothetical protein K432DRAFT_449539 [Lepidopterella palustris CBS 459.81]|uniref:Uncharacterized protein n=1 Tax=Lepidopterella palustris CBS 459.81 TaxID=1314670 RepID=A0A8E2ECM7_9PEZI|nr:hypothetical protein K432DRAFT_449539 [Lepidopterella palustris CBS 459.81]
MYHRVNWLHWARHDVLQSTLWFRLQIADLLPHPRAGVPFRKHLHGVQTPGGYLCLWIFILEDIVALGWLLTQEDIVDNPM